MLHLINSEAEYQAAQERLKTLQLSNPSQDSEEQDELELLTYLIASYERHTEEK